MWESGKATKEADERKAKKPFSFLIMADTTTSVRPSSNQKGRATLYMSFGITLETNPQILHLLTFLSAEDVVWLEQRVQSRAHSPPTALNQSFTKFIPKNAYHTTTISHGSHMWPCTHPTAPNPTPCWTQDVHTVYTKDFQFACLRGTVY